MKGSQITGSMSSKGMLGSSCFSLFVSQLSSGEQSPSCHILLLSYTFAVTDCATECCSVPTGTGIETSELWGRESFH